MRLEIVFKFEVDTAGNFADPTTTTWHNGMIAFVLRKKI